MKIAVIGAGAIGGYVGAKLALSGEDVSFIVRGANLAAIRSRGMKLVMADGTQHIASSVRATSDYAEAGPQDLVILAMKAHQVEAVAKDVPKLFGPDTAVVTMQNGIPYWYFHKHAGAFDPNPVWRSLTMVLDWLKKLSGGPTGKPRDNGTDRNAVIKRVVAGASEEAKKTDSGVVATVEAPAPTESLRPTPPPSASPLVLPRDKIAQRAFEIWVRKGRPFGTSDHDWLEAEAELQRELHDRPDGQPLPNKPR